MHWHCGLLLHFFYGLGHATLNLEASVFVVVRGKVRKTPTLRVLDGFGRRDANNCQWCFSMRS